jgi:tRNA-modifying protein YgfZ
MTGYEALRSGAAWFDLSDRGMIRVTGEDRTRLLHAMTTNNIEKLEPSHACYTFFLNAQGRVLADANVFAFDDSYVLETEPELGGKVRDHLDKYIIADDVTLSDETAQWGIIAVEGPSTKEVLTSLGAPAPEQPWVTASWHNGFVAAVSATGAEGFRIIVPTHEKAQLISKLNELDVPEAGKLEVDIVRLEHGQPRYGDDITERNLAQETNQVHAIAFGKGCYLGQEIVERVRSRAQLHRMLNPVRIRSQSTPPSGTKLSVEGKDMAEITSAAFSPALGEVVALAYARVEQIESRREMVAGGMNPPATAYLP